MEDNAQRQIRRIFSKYYANATLEVIRPEQREYGVGIHKKIDYRHLAFPGVPELRAYLANNPPLYVSHSTAYYRYPDATPIEKKEWRGSDLVFDLDLQGEKFGIYTQLPQAKQDALRLIEEFLMRDFGIGKKEIRLVFSGNRGYHVHVHHPDFVALGSNERKGLVDYIRGVGLNYEGFFTTDEIRKGVIKLKGPTPEEDGYRGKFAQAVLKKLETAPASIARVFSKPEARGLFSQGIREGNWSKAPIKENILPRLKSIAGELPLHAVNADAGVTQDLSKLIRVPNSIHGETGWIAKVVKDWEGFEPLRDALLPLKSVATIRFLEDIPPMEFGGDTMGPFRKGDKKDLSRTFALFVILKGSAELEG